MNVDTGCCYLLPRIRSSTAATRSELLSGSFHRTECAYEVYMFQVLANASSEHSKRGCVAARCSVPFNPENGMTFHVIK
jgi:hypothetical protein